MLSFPTLQKFLFILDNSMDIIRICQFQLFIFLISMWILIPIFLLFLLVVLILKCYIEPKRQYNKYRNILEGLGYKVHAIPFRAFAIPFVAIEKESLEKYNDSCYISKDVAGSSDVILTNTANIIVLFLTSPDLIKEYFNMENALLLEKSKVLTLGLKKIAGKGLFLSEGNEWKKKRKILSKVFNFDLVKGNIGEIANICDSSLDKFEENCKIDDNEYSDFGIKITANIANRIILKCFFGEDNFKEEIKGVPISNVIVEMVEDSVKISFSPLVLLFGNKAFDWNLTNQIKKYKETITIFNSICQAIVQRKTKEIQQEIQKNPAKDQCKDLLQALLREKKRCQAEGQQFVYAADDIIQQFATFIIAGTDTTSNFVVLMLYYIFSDPEIEAKLRREIDQHIKSNDDYTYDKLKNLVYLQCVQKQTSRHYGPATVLVPKKPTEDTYIGNIPIYKGTSVTVSFFGSHYNPKFFKDPHQFRPQRWEKECDNLHPYAFVAFGGGPRGCIGKQLAYLQSKILIVKLLKRYKMIVVPKEIKLINGFIYFASMQKISFYK